MQFTLDTKPSPNSIEIQTTLAKFRNQNNAELALSRWMHLTNLTLITVENQWCTSNWNCPLVSLIFHCNVNFETGLAFIRPQGCSTAVLFPSFVPRTNHFAKKSFSWDFERALFQEKKSFYRRIILPRDACTSGGMWRSFPGLFCVSGIFRIHFSGNV